LPEDLRNKIPTYIKENINLERFINAWWSYKKEN
jgi:hypothetical protein